MTRRAVLLFALTYRKLRSGHSLLT